MNRIYRLIWSASRGALTVVSELARSRHTGTTGGQGAPRRLKAMPLTALAICLLSCGLPAFAQSTGNARLDDLQGLMDKYAPVTPQPTSPTPRERASRPAAVAVAGPPMERALAAVPPRQAPVGRSAHPPAGTGTPASAASHGAAASLAPRVLPRKAGVSALADETVAPTAPTTSARRDVSLAAKQVHPTSAAPQAAVASIAGAGSAAGKTDPKKASAKKSAHAAAVVDADAYDDTDGAEKKTADAPTRDAFPLARTSLSSALPLPAEFPVVGREMASNGFAITQDVPVVPPPGPAPTGIIIGNGGVVGTVTQLLGTSSNALFQNSSGYVTNGSLRVDNANFTQGYSTLNLLGLPVLNLTPVGTLLTTTGGTTLGGTGINSHLTLVGGVQSGNYISNINNGAAGGALGIVLPNGAPAWASTCLNVLGVLTEQCWALNAAQDYQVLVGDGASANGSKEVVIGTGASHTLPTVDAATAFPGDGRNDPNNPSGVPTADYEARMGHSVVIGDEASGNANAQTILGAEATATVANSVALGYQSNASRGALSGYTAYGLSAPQNSAGEVSIGSAGQERQITHVAAGRDATDAVNVAQLQGVAAVAGNSVQYDDASLTSVTLAGPVSTDGGLTGGTTVSNVHQGDVSVNSTDAINGSQLYATNQNITNIYDLGTKYFQANSTGTASSALGADAVAAGVDSRALGINSIAVGNGATAGDSADPTQGDEIAIGDGATASAAGSLALGGGSNVGVAQGTALGSGAQVTVVGGIALGQGSIASTAAGQAGYIPPGASAADLAAINATTGTLGALSIADPGNGQYRQITGVAAGTAASDAVNVAQLTAVGDQLSDLGASAVQYDSNPDGTPNFNSVTLAATNSTDGGVTGGTTLTNLHQGELSATSTDAVNGSQLYATNQTINNIYDVGTKYFQANSTGAGSNAAGADSVAMGTGAVASGADDVALGANSVTAAAHTGPTAFFGGAAAGAASSVLSIGAIGQERQIQNVAPGVLAVDSTDAVNGSQLYSVVAGVDTLGNSIAAGLGGSSAYDSGTGTLTTSLSYGGSSYNSVQNVLNALTGGGTGSGVKYFHANSTLADSNADGVNAVAVGPVAEASGDDSVAIGNAAVASATDALAFGAGASADMANSIALGAGSATLVGALSNYTAYGLVTPQNSAGEVNVGNRQITGVAAGSAADDAVNVAQLEAVGNQVQSVDKLAVKYDPDSAGNATNTITLSGDGSGSPVLITNLADGAETVNSSDAVNGSQLWHWTQDTSNIYSNYSLYNDIQNLSPGGAGSMKYFHANSTLADSSATGSNSVAVGPVAKASGDDSVAVGNGATASGDNSVALGAGSVADRDNTVSVGSDGNDRQITHVAAGTASTDAVNVGQLDASVSASQKGTVRYDTHEDGSVDYNNVTLGNGAGDTTVHNVAAGVADSDAANVGQVNAGIQQGVNWANAYTDRRVQQLGNRANAGVAAAMAMAGLPQAYLPGKSMAAVAAGSFRGESSLAIGVSTISQGGRWVYKLTGSTDTRGDAGVTIGAGMQW